MSAEASLALAEAGAIAFEELDVALRVEPDAFAPWYVLGIKALNDAGKVAQDRIQAVKGTSPIFKILLAS